MNIGGFQRVSFLDFPGKIASIIFTNGCAFRCGYCFNSHLVLNPIRAFVPEETIFAHLNKRKGALDGVVVTGGEPTVQPDLIDFIQKVKALNFSVKLDTCGCRPEVLMDVLGLRIVDYIAMDIKAPLERYEQVVGVPVRTMDILESVEMIMNSHIPHEFRSTVIDGIHTADDVVEMAKLVEGADAYYLQRFKRTDHLLNPNYQSKQAPSDEFLKQVTQACRPYVKHCEVR
jgi:pyruvate formate lyase activating enzyme